MRRWTDEFKAEIVRMVEYGLTYSQVAAAKRISRSSVASIVAQRRGSSKKVTLPKLTFMDNR